MSLPIYSHHETIGGETVRVLEGYEADEAIKAAATIVYGTKPDTYRELLELAAKAAGITGFLGAWFDDGYQRGFLSGRLGNGRSVWNPRDDDGDALRLAVDLSLAVYTSARTTGGSACVAVADCLGTLLVEDISPGDPRSATRHAILRAAAEVGRAMP